MAGEQTAASATLTRDQATTRIDNRRLAGDLLSDLPEIPLLSILDDYQREQLIDKCTFRGYAAGETIIREGEAGDALFVVVRGEAGVYIDQPGDSEQQLNDLGRGDFFGEISFFSGIPRSATVRALTNVQLLEIGRDHLAILVARFSGISETLQRYYKQRLVGTVLNTSPLFEPLTPIERIKLIDDFEYIEAPFGEIVINQGTPPAGLYVIGAGRVVVTSQDDNQDDIMINAMGAGDFFGEISAITGRDATASCITAERSVLFKLPTSAFESIIERYPQVLEIAVGIASDRLKRSQDLMQVRSRLIQEGLL